MTLWTSPGFKHELQLNAFPTTQLGTLEVHWNILFSVYPSKYKLFLFKLVSSSSYEMNMDWVVVQCYRTWDHMVLHCSEYIGRKWRNAFILSFHFFIDTWLSLVITVLLTIFQYFHHFWLLLIHNGFNGISDFEMSLIWILNDNGGSLVMKN